MDNDYTTELMPTNPGDIIAAIKEQRCDLVLIDTGAEQDDHVRIMNQVRSENLGERMPLFMALTFPDEAKERDLCANGADYIFIRPVDIAGMVERAISLVEISDDIWHDSVEDEARQQINFGETVAELLRNIGVPVHLAGYQYLKDAVIMALEHPDILSAITKELYPSVAKRNFANPSGVARAIRHVVELAWANGDPMTSNPNPGNTIRSKRGPPTNAEFIAAVADKARLQHLTNFK